MTPLGLFGTHRSSSEICCAGGELVAALIVTVVLFTTWSCLFGQYGAGTPEAVHWRHSCWAGPTGCLTVAHNLLGEPVHPRDGLDYHPKLLRFLGDRKFARAMGFQATTLCLGSKYSTIELRPLGKLGRDCTLDGKGPTRAHARRHGSTG